MNFINVFETRAVAVAVELKYCERCGGLWLRRQGQETVYCGSCRAQMATLLRLRRWPGSEQSGAPSPVRIDWLLGVAQTEVRA